MSNPISKFIKHIQFLSSVDKAVESLQEMQYEQLVSKKRQEAIDGLCEKMTNPNTSQEVREYLSKISINDITTCVDTNGKTLFHIINKNIKGHDND